jgi:hypothetical protein
MAIYDDSSTNRIGDYSDIYNRAGDHLIAVIWFDQFGIIDMPQTAAS